MDANRAAKRLNNNINVITASNCTRTEEACNIVLWTLTTRESSALNFSPSHFQLWRIWLEIEMN
jgi:hypothetical protein